MQISVFKGWVMALLMGFSLSVQANHIIGGDMFYDCLGFLNGDPSTNQMVYRITIDLYRDCQAQNAAFFDRPAGVSVFRERGNDYELFDNIPVFYQNPIRTIDPPNFPCLNVPSNVCVHTARYEFEVTLPIINDNWHIVWQRCCRNSTINNIFFPGDVGATFTVMLTPTAQQLCNNSPRFNNFPPTVICVNEPLRFDHAATDPDGDNLVYEFCAPLVGGGNIFQGNGCDTPNPNPDCPPPFGTVDFRAPQYTSSYPLAGNPRVTIDPITGLITGTPEDLGQFVVGVCVKEYNNGELLSTIRRDFQFNVSTCQANFRADLQGDITNADGSYVFQLCDTLSRTLQNRSAGLIDSVLWEIDLGDDTLVSKSWRPTLNFPKGGSFKGLFVINPNTPCSDSVELRFDVVEELTAQFVATYDTCNPGPVQFTNQSKVIGSQIASYDWDLDERIMDTVVNPVAEYQDPGTYNISLIIRDTVGCVDTANQELTWQPAPEVIIIQPNVEEGCVPLNVGFENLSFPIDSTYRIEWFFSDGDTILGFSPQKIFSDTGIYSIKVEVTSPIGCYNERSFDSVVQVFPLPIARFAADKYDMDIFDATVELTDTSANSSGREWWFENGTAVYFDSTLQYTFMDTGVHIVTIYAVDRFGCVDTLSKLFDVRPVNTVYFPNAFTPNTDGKNDEFMPVGLMDGIFDYQLTIYNRWGEIVFSSDQPSVGWNGQMSNSGDYCDPGLYVFECTYTEPRGEEVEIKNYLTLIR